MSFVREFIDTSAEINVIETKKKICELDRELKHFQNKIRDYIKANYSEFLHDVTSNGFLLDEGRNLTHESEDLINNVNNTTKEELFKASDELKQFLEDLKESALGMNTSLKLLRIDDRFKMLNAIKSQNDQRKIMEIVGELKILINDPNDKILPKLECYQNMKIRYQVESEMMLHNLKLKFENLVQLKEKSFQNTKSITVKITKDKDDLHETVIALINSKYNPKKICDFLLDNIFDPIITKPVSLELNETDDQESVSMVISFSNKDTKIDLRPNYKIVFKNIEKAVHCLSFMNISISDERCVFSIFAEYIKEHFFKLLINECLLYSIPGTMDEMEESTLIDDIKQLNNFLVTNQFFSLSDDNLIKYSEKIDILFQNRFCSNIIDNSIDIMHKDLHEMVLVDNSISEASIFPRCMVSKSTFDLINLLEKIKKQSENVKQEIADRLCSSISIILDRYLTEMPTFHAKLLQNIPQQTALFYNNCMYLASWLQKNSNFSIEYFETIGSAIQDKGNEYFQIQVKNQKSQIMDILKDFHLSHAISELSPELYKIVRQCIRQMDLLKNVWQTILPDDIYNKTMGCILDDFIVDIIRHILMVEDIPAAVANGLVDICTIILDRAPLLFNEKYHAQTNVPSWMKLMQMKMILNASLAEITTQWSERKGPLALNYRPDEIKHLIRALFQNTDRRSQALSLIV